MLRSVLLAATASTLVAPAFANTVTTNAVQLTLTKAAINQTGVTQGGIYAVQGNGRAKDANSPTLPTIDATGLVNSVSNFRSVANQPFSFTVTARQADTVGAGGNIAANSGRHTGTFSDMTTKTTGASGNAPDLGSIAINGAGAITIAAGVLAGSTATGIISSTNAGRYAQVENRRIATSSNTQNITNSDVQQAKFSAAGEGVEAVTAGGIALMKDGNGQNIAAAKGAVIGIAALAGANASLCTNGQGSNCANGNSFNLTNEVTVSQAGAAMSATSEDASTPGYGVVDYSVGGTTAGAITMTDLNTVSVIGGKAGTSSSLSQVGELTAFN